jgi:hypothetical protein
MSRLANRFPGRQSDFHEDSHHTVDNNIHTHQRALRVRQMSESTDKFLKIGLPVILGVTIVGLAVVLAIVIKRCKSQGMRGLQ